MITERILAALTTMAIYSLPALGLPVNPDMPQNQGMHFVRIPAGTVVPVFVATDVYTHALRPGDRLLAQTSKDIRLPSGEVLSAGTSFFADVAATHPEALFGPDTRLMRFDRMQLHDGTYFPIEASVRSAGSLVDTFVIPPSSDLHIPQGQCLLLEFSCPAQVAVTGNAM